MYDLYVSPTYLIEKCIWQTYNNIYTIPLLLHIGWVANWRIIGFICA